jgi:DNA-binding NtrC family response regulator
MSYKNIKNDSKDIDYKNKNLDNSSGDSISQKEESNNNDKPLAKLLVIDDDSDILHVLKLGLQKNRLLVNAFTNPEDALQRFKSDAESYCLLLSDVRMPALSGIQLSKKVKEINPAVKTVLMTAFEIKDSEFSMMFPSSQIDGFVQKPVGIEDLTNKILSLVGGSKRRIDGEQ